MQCNMINIEHYARWWFVPQSNLRLPCAGMWVFVCMRGVLVAWPAISSNSFVHHKSVTRCKYFDDKYH